MKTRCSRTVPVPATLAWLLEAQIQLNSPDADLIFTTPTGRLWRERNFYRDFWCPAQEASGLDIRPHECWHSYVTHLRAAGVNDADLAEIAGHRVETMLARYTHATRPAGLFGAYGLHHLDREAGGEGAARPFHGFAGAAERRDVPVELVDAAVVAVDAGEERRFVGRQIKRVRSVVVIGRR